MNLIISLSNAMTRWLKLSLPRLPSLDGKRIGTQILHTDTQQLTWQCHVINHGPRSNPYFTVIAMEAYSRYVIMLPFTIRPTQAEFEQTLLERWGNEALHLAMQSGAINDDELPLMVDAFTHHPCQSQWVSNTDLSIQGHISDAGRWLLNTLEQEGLDFLDANQCYGLGMHINQLTKKIGGRSTAHFHPMVRFMEDTLYRFGDSLSEREYPNTKMGNFPCPYPAPPRADNVVQLADYQTYMKKQR